MNRFQTPLFRRRLGSATLEYVVLVAVVAGGLLFIAWEAMERRGDLLQSVSSVLGRSPSELRTRPAIENGAADGAGSTSRRSTAFNVFTMVVLCVAVGGWLIERRARKSHLERAKAADQQPGRRVSDAARGSRSRLTEKRLKILNTLISDNHKLLPSDLKVGDLMTTAVTSALATTTASELRKIISENHFRHVLICDAGGGLAGIVSDRDLRNVDDMTPASAVMVDHPTTVSPDSRVNDAITQLLYGHFSSLPVVTDGRLVGIVTTTDVVMTLQCTLLAVEQMVMNLRADRLDRDHD